MTIGIRSFTILITSIGSCMMSITSVGSFMILITSIRSFTVLINSQAGHIKIMISSDTSRTNLLLTVSRDVQLSMPNHCLHCRRYWTITVKRFVWQEVNEFSSDCFFILFELEVGYEWGGFVSVGVAPLVSSTAFGIWLDRRRWLVKTSNQFSIRWETIWSVVISCSLLFFREQRGNA